MAQPGEAIRFSVIIPCRDDQAGLDRAVASVLGQTVDDLEVIVVDDGSTPPMKVADDPRVRVVRRDTAGGPARARNAGLEVARGEIVGWCDSDDFFAPRRLEIADRLHATADVVVVGQCHADHPVSTASVPPDLNSVLNGHNPSFGATTVARAHCQRLDDRFVALQDVEWWIRMISAGSRYRAIGQVGYLVTSDDRERLLNSTGARLDFSYVVLDLHSAFYRQRPTAAAFRWLRIAAMERQEGNVPLAVAALRHSIRLGRSSLVIKESVRVAREWLTPREQSRVIGEKPIGPLGRLRARRLYGLRVGTAESRQVFESQVVDFAARVSVHAPRRLRGRIRRAATFASRSPEVTAGTAWGRLPLRTTEVRLIAPYTDEPFEMALLSRLLKPGMTAVDIGANRGVYTLMFSSRVGETGTVIAVEPDPRMNDRLQKLVEVNGFTERTMIIEAVVAGSSGQRDLTLAAEPSLNHLSVGDSLEGERLSVQAYSYGDLVRGCDRVDVVKVDVEGAEPEILASIVAADADVQPTVLVFEFEQSHWARSGHSGVEPALQTLGAQYDLFLIDYRSGALLPMEASALRSWSGRNVLALRRERIGSLDSFPMLPIGDQEAQAR